MPHTHPLCVIIGGPNGAGKTTFAREFLPNEAGLLNYINVDLIAAGLSPLQPHKAALIAGKLFLAELDRLVTARASFSFETTFSGRNYAEHIMRWREMGYRIEIVYLALSSPGLALKRVAARVKEGGHHVTEVDVRRRFERSQANFMDIYRHLADAWWLYDASVRPPALLEKSHEG